MRHFKYFDFCYGCIYSQSNVPWNVSESISGLRSRPVGVVFVQKVNMEKKQIFLEKNKKCLMVVVSLIKML